MDHFKNKFLNEAADLLADLEKSILVLEEDAGNKDQVEQVFRVMHTFKGNSTMFGFDSIGEFTHHLETIYDLVRSGKLNLTSQILDVTLKAVDHIRALLLDEDLLNEAIKSTHTSLTESIIQLSGAVLEKSNTAEENFAKGSEQTRNDVNSYFIVVRPSGNIFLTGANPLYLIDDLYNLGECKAYPIIENIPSLTQLDTNVCYTNWQILLSTSGGIPAIKDVFIFAEDDCTVEISFLANINLLANSDFISEVESLYKTNKTIESAQVLTIASKFIVLDTVLTPNIKNESVVSSLADIKIPKSVKSEKKENSNSSIRVSSDKLDDLMNLVSELVTTQARLSLFAEQSSQSELLNIAENVEKISRQLRDNTFSICLVPIESMLTRFKRLVRDLSAELDKDVIFITEGSDTELDKTIIDSLSDPLMHIIRNSMDHGIESVEERIQNKKPSQGKIQLKAFYSGTNVHIEIEDDGGGIDPKKIKEKAIQKGIIAGDAILSEKEILEMIFLPGFSTASKVTEVSGRGVGMDVVKRNIANIRGEISLKSSVGKGTTITIKLPLTLSIIDGLLVKIGDTHFVLPLSSIEKCYETLHTNLVDNFNDLVVLDGEQIPYFYLREEFDITEDTPVIEQVLVVKYEDRKVGLSVDEVVGEYQAVIKPLGKLYKNLEIISGATILGDGSIALVMDTNQIIKQFSGQSKKKILNYEH